MVSLSSVFFPHQVLDTGKIKSILELAPKIAWGGSEAGTKSSSPESGVPIDEHRLYPTVDELLYRHSGSETNAKGESPRENNLVFANDGARKLLERSRFFLTANSNGPEITMHGTPRFSMWPLHADVGADTFSSYDHLIEYCTNIGGAKYYFRRRTASNRHGETYRILAAHNGEMLYNYLDIHTTQTIPGYGRSIAQKYGAGDNSDGFQILTQCWDYSRCSNLSDPNVNRKYGDGRGQVASSCLCGGPPRGQGGTNEHRFRWDQPNSTFPAKGLGRLYTASEVTLVFIGATPSDETTGGTAIEIGVLVEVFCPNHGFSKIIPNGSIQLNGPPAGNDRNSNSQPGPFRVNGKEIELIRNVSKSEALQGGAEKGARPWGAHGGPRMFGTVIQFQTKQAGTENADEKIPVSGETIEISVEGPMRVITYDEKNGQDIYNLIQMAVLEWPKSFTIPKPSISSDSWKDRIEKIASGAMDRDQLIRPGDVTRSMVVAHGDYRHTTAKRLSEPELFQPHFEFKEGVSQVQHAHSLTDADGFKFHGFSVERDMIPGANYAEEYVPDFPISPANASFAPLAQNKGYSMDPAVNGDWDNGVSIHLDGPYSGRPDDGSAEGNNPYFDKTAIGTNNNSTSKAYFSPNRLISGPGMFGSLPTGVRSNVPWRTLLFRPNTEHFGAPNNPETGDIPDHLFMDLFWMPVVEPYAISMPFATRGKINLNYQIIPFDNIKRATALHALMKAERVLAIPTGAGATYKTAGKDEWRHEINAYETLEQAEDRFEDNRIFRSPSEICELYLVPKNESIGSRSGKDYPSMRTFWEAHKLTGDNVKERPYANMYPRLTTKSNVFKVHMIVQTLKKVRSSKVDVFDPDKDKVSGQWSGSAIIERFIDPNDERIPDYRGDRNFRQPSLENFYNYRVLHVKQFTS
jgi:uncharacterized protein (TIGR02600 family)